MPVMQWLYPKVEVSRFGSDQKSSEKVAGILLNMVHSLNNFYSPTKHFTKFADKLEQIQNSGMIEKILQCIKEYCAT